VVSADGVLVEEAKICLAEETNKKKDTSPRAAGLASTHVATFSTFVASVSADGRVLVEEAKIYLAEETVHHTMLAEEWENPSPTFAAAGAAPVQATVAFHLHLWFSHGRHGLDEKVKNVPHPALVNIFHPKYLFGEANAPACLLFFIRRDVLSHELVSADRKRRGG
jgi:hypothetical protein